MTDHDNTVCGFDDCVSDHSIDILSVHVEDVTDHQYMLWEFDLVCPHGSDRCGVCAGSNRAFTAHCHCGVSLDVQVDLVAGEWQVVEQRGLRDV